MRAERGARPARGPVCGRNSDGGAGKEGATRQDSGGEGHGDSAAGGQKVGLHGEANGGLEGAGEELGTVPEGYRGWEGWSASAADWVGAALGGELKEEQDEGPD